MTRNGATYYYHHDGLGSVTEVTDAAGAVVENYTYDVYGQPSVTNSLIGNPYRFTGREYDEESGIYYYRARSYAPGLGRFLQRDPLGYYDSMNLFEYAFNSPVNWVDPWGEDVWAPTGMPVRPTPVIPGSGPALPIGPGQLPGPDIPAPETPLPPKSCGQGQGQGQGQGSGQASPPLMSSDPGSGTGNSNKGKEKKPPEKKKGDEGTTEIKERGQRGSDGGRSQIRKEMDKNGKTKEVWHEVFDKDGNITHRDWKGPGFKPPRKPKVK